MRFSLTAVFVVGVVGVIFVWAGGVKPEPASTPPIACASVTLPIPNNNMIDNKRPDVLADDFNELTMNHY